VAKDTLGLYQEEETTPTGETPANYFRRDPDPMEATASELDALVAEAKLHSPKYEQLMTNFPNAHLIVTDLSDPDSFVVIEVTT